MFTHQQIWAAIDAIAEIQGISASALAIRAGLDPTAFNRSKRVSRDGRARWPSTETLSKILMTSRLDLRALADLIDRLPNPDAQDADQPRPKSKRKHQRQSGQVTQD
jgi:phage repressor protein C with HTH and peptisase S24 domain